MNTYMKMSAKEQDHRDFLNSLRERLNVDDQTIANLEKRITGKQLKLQGALSEKLTVQISARGFLVDSSDETRSRASGSVFLEFCVFSGRSRPGSQCDPWIAPTGFIIPRLTFKFYNIKFPPSSLNSENY